MSTPISLHYTEHGTGLPVLLLHGFPFDHSIWRFQAEALSDSFRVITPDLRGHGASPVTGGATTMDLLARDVLGLLDQLGIERAVWVGHSMGGYVTLAALRLAPERIVGVGLVATHPFADPPAKRQQRMDNALTVLEKGVSGLATGMLDVLFAPGCDPQSAIAQDVYRLMLKTAPEGVAGAQRGMAERPDSVEVLRQLACPALVLTGAADQLVSSETASAMVDMIPMITNVSISGAGHMLMLEQPAATEAALRRFLTWLEAERGNPQAGI